MQPGISAGSKSRDLRRRWSHRGLKSSPCTRGAPLEPRIPAEKSKDTCMKTAITLEFLRKPPPGPCDVWDVKCKGLVLRIRESGTATWTFQYGRSKRVTLGRADAIPPA